MIENGFIKLYRSLVSWEWYSDIITSRVFIHLLLTVNFEDIQWQGITIKRGERVYSFASLSDEIGITVQQLRSALKRLTITNEITSRSTTKYSVVTVKNYDRYQGATHQSTNEQHSNQQAINTQPNKQTTHQSTSKSTNTFSDVSADITEENDFDNESITSDSTSTLCGNQQTKVSKINTPINNNIRSNKNKEDKNDILPPISPKGENRSSEIDHLLYESLFGDDLKNKIKEWLMYKQERKEPYKPMGFKSLLTEIKNNVDIYGESAVINLINQCMSNGYKGIIFDILKKAQASAPYQPKQGNSGNPFLDILNEMERNEQ